MITKRKRSLRLVSSEEESGSESDTRSRVRRKNINYEEPDSDIDEEALLAEQRGVSDGEENASSYNVTLNIGQRNARIVERHLAKMANGNGHHRREMEEEIDEHTDLIPRGQISRKSVRIDQPTDDTNDNDDDNINDNDDNDNDVNNGRHPRLEDSEDEEEEMPRARRTRSAMARKKDDSDEYHESDDVDEEVSSGEKEVLSDRGFVVDDSDDYARPRRRRGRPPKKSRKLVNRRRKAPPPSSDFDDDFEEEAEDALELQEELRELRGDISPPPRRKHLRARKEVNYQILPPPALDETFEASVTATNNANKRGRSSGPLRRLFPTTGPFGGHDVVSLFGAAAAPPPLGQQNPTTIGDSDSSDDDIANVTRPFGAPTGGSVGLGKKKTGLADTDPLGVDMNIDFDSVGGLDEYINKLQEMITLPLRYPEIYKRFAITPPRGVLFHGPPGTGKTLVARALASSCSHGGKKVTFFMRKGADCLSKWVGEAERQLRLLFEEAKNQQPSIIFFDEIDGLAPVRSSKQEQIHASIVSTLLALMDGMDNRGQVIVIGATNRPDSVDPALRRPGRFDREFYFPLPDFEARKKIISIHTKKWDPPLDDKFISKVAGLTKGYGGADLRALCTEAALNAIQRKYPQIYMSEKKLKIDPASIHASAADFMKSIDKIIPSSARSTSSGAQPLPARIEPLLRSSYAQIVQKLDRILPRKKKLTALEEAMYENGNDDDEEGFAKQEAMKTFQSARIFRPRLLIHGHLGMGQQYVGSAVLHHLEGYHVQSFDLGTLLSDSARTPEAAIVQLLVEVKRRKPSVVFLPNVNTWFATMSEAAKSTFRGIVRSINPTDSILILGLAETSYEELSPEVKAFFGLSGENRQELAIPNEEVLNEFYGPLLAYVRSKPSDYPDPENRKKRVLEVLEEAPQEEERQLSKAELKQQERRDRQLKNSLKVRLSPTMNVIKNTYKRFRKPPIEDALLVHLFEEPVKPATKPPVTATPTIATNEGEPPAENRNESSGFGESLQVTAMASVAQEPEVRPAYVKEGDMILETATGKKYYNMDLDIIEERLWNGYYCEAKQFVKDIEMIFADAATSEDRERRVKAQEMLANVQVVVEDIVANDPTFAQQCKDMHQREIARVKEYQKKVEQMSTKASNEPSGEVTNGPHGPPLAPMAMTNGLVDDSQPDVPMENGVVEPEATFDGNTANGNVINVPPSSPPPNGQIDEAEKPSNGQSYHEPIMSESTKDENSNELGENGPTNELCENGYNALEVNIQDKDSKAEVHSPEPDPEPVLVPEPEPEPDLILDEDLLVQFSKNLVSSTKGMTVEQLEQVNSYLIDVVWKLKSNWNRNDIIHELEKTYIGVIETIIAASEFD